MQIVASPPNNSTTTPLGCLSWGTFATCLFQTARCKRAPQKKPHENRPAPRQRHQETRQVPARKKTTTDGDAPATGRTRKAAPPKDSGDTPAARKPRAPSAATGGNNNG